MSYLDSRRAHFDPRGTSGASCTLGNSRHLAKTQWQTLYPTCLISINVIFDKSYNLDHLTEGLYANPDRLRWNAIEIP